MLTKVLHVTGSSIFPNLLRTTITSEKAKMVTKPFLYLEALGRPSHRGRLAAFETPWNS